MLHFFKHASHLGTFNALLNKHPAENPSDLTMFGQKEFYFCQVSDKGSKALDRKFKEPSKF